MPHPGASHHSSPVRACILAAERGWHGRRNAALGHGQAWGGSGDALGGPAPPGALAVTVGAAGSGKTTFLARRFPAEAVVSADAIRHELAGDAAVQDQDARVWRILVARATRASAGAGGRWWTRRPRPRGRAGCCAGSRLSTARRSYSCCSRRRWPSVCGGMRRGATRGVRPACRPGSSSSSSRVWRTSCAIPTRCQGPRRCRGIGVQSGRICLIQAEDPWVGISQGRGWLERGEGSKRRVESLERVATEPRRP